LLIIECIFESQISQLKATLAALDADLEDLEGSVRYVFKYFITEVAAEFGGRSGWWRRREDDYLDWKRRK
jgi:hypothetical protein